ncbi:Lrp/AsnC family transcriptional regulator, partial [Acinetobacter baumannii]|uniref:Lrp/AsnC family transcriptional regulator n=1 Tax=Acinetobacter baumannii TaxID=470 RepID=UPI00387AF0BE
MNSTEYALDRIDRKILSALRRNGRLTVAQLAEEVGLSSSPCWTRLKRLESLKIIEGYTVNVNPKAIGIHELFWHCCKVSDEAAFCLIQRPYISKTLLT